MKNILIKIKALTFLFLLTTSIASSQVQLDFRFANPEYINGIFLFDVEVKASEAGAYHRDLQLYINYNTEAFGTNAASNAIMNQQDLLFPAFYQALAIANNTESRMAVITESLFEMTLTGNSGLFLDVPTEFTPLCKFFLPVYDDSKPAGLSFDQQLMNGGQYLQDLNSTQPIACAEINQYANDWSNLYIPGQTLVLDQGWSGISGHLVPEQDDVVQIFDPVINDMVILNDLTNIYYPAQNINTLANWDYSRGYLLKMDNATQLKMNGFFLDNQNLEIAQGWSLIPVLSSCYVDVETVFGGVPEIFVKEVAGGKVYWPDYGINSLGNLESGKSYFVLAQTEMAITYPECNGLKTQAVEVFNQKPENQIGNNDDISEFNIAQTSSTHTIALQDIHTEIDAGNYILAKDENDNTFGIAQWQGETTSLTVFGDDPLTAEKDGFLYDEGIFLQAFDPNTKEFADIDGDWDVSLASHDGLFHPNGLSAVSALKLSASNLANIESGKVLIYPNPAAEQVSIEISSPGTASVSVFDVSGQLVLQEIVSGEIAKINLAGLEAGIYFIEVKGETIFKTEQLIVK